VHDYLVLNITEAVQDADICNGVCDVSNVARMARKGTFHYLWLRELSRNLFVPSGRPDNRSSLL